MAPTAITHLPNAPPPIAVLLHHGQQDIVDRWAHRVLNDPAIPAAKQLDEPALREAVPRMLDQLAATLASARDALGASTLPAVEASVVQAHARTRIAARYTFGEVVRELSHLHAVLFEHWAAVGVAVYAPDTILVHTALGVTTAETAAEIEIAAQAELRFERERLQTVLRALPVGVCICDAEGRITEANTAAEAIWGRPPHPIEGPADYGLYQAWWPSTGRRVEALEWGLARALLHGEVSRDVELDILSFEGVGRTILASALPLRDASGAVVGAVMAHVDVTERARIARALQHEAELRERFIAVLGHDLRTPLTSIKLAAAALLRRGHLPDDSVRTLTRVLSSAERMARMIADLLDFARARLGGGISIVLQPADLTAICRQAIREIHALHPGRSVLLRSNGQTRGRWDPDRLTQVASNLIGNAVDYSPTDAEVQVSVSDEGEEVVLEVHNLGPPIPPDELSTIFEPFHRGSTPARGLPSNGLGLGLFIAREIVRAHGGRIEVESDAARGTTFTTRLPRGAPAAEAEPGAARTS